MCVRPIKAYRSSDGTLFFSSKPGTNVFRVPCGQCVECRLKRSRDWAARCMQEASQHERNCFITLTYRDAPESLDYRDFQLFMKRLRKVAPGVRFYMCGEYGEEGSRPHFHACLFGFDFDRVRFKGSLSRSVLLERLWPHGFSCVGDLTFESAAYVARYVMKKVTGDAASPHYMVVDGDTGEIRYRKPEFCHMSLKPGIGGKWLDRYWTDVFPDGRMVVRGTLVNSPRYYDLQLRRRDRLNYDHLKYARGVESQVYWRENLDKRLAVRETVVRARLRLLKRSTF